MKKNCFGGGRPKQFYEVIRMDEWDPCEDEIDWLCGEYTYKKDRLRRELQRLESGWDDF
jgi:hypothetical protein